MTELYKAAFYFYNMYVMPRSHSGEGAVNIMASEVEKPRIQDHRSSSKKRRETVVTWLKIQQSTVLCHHSTMPA